MIARRLTFIVILLHAVACSGAALRTPPDIPEQPLIRTIYEWRDQIAVITQHWIPSEKRWTYALSVVSGDVSRVIPFQGLSCDSYHDVAYGEKLGKLLVCGVGGSARVYQLDGELWKPLSQPIQGREFRLAVNGERIALLSGHALYVMPSSSTKEFATIPVNIDDFASSALLTENALLVAYDSGEFGGGILRVDLKHLNTAKIASDNISVLARSRSGVVWAAGGVGHMGVVRGTLYRIEGDRVEVVATISGFRGLQDGGDEIRRERGVRFPGLTEISGLSLRRADRPTVVLSAFGVFELADDKFVSLYEAALEGSYETKLSNGIELTVGSSPVGLAISDSGDIFVASTSLGIFALQRNNERYDIKQLIFESAHN